MGEYATRRDTGERVKIGTCESMYYLRADQVRDVIAETGNVNPIADAAGIRFRFPFPDEDNIAPGNFEQYNRALTIRGLEAPTGEGWGHYSVQFKDTSGTGYLVSLPCPESGDDSHGLKVHRNGFVGAVSLVQQVWHDGLLVPVLQCRCGMAWRLRTRTDAAPLCEALMQMHEDHAARIDPTPEYTPELEILRRVLRGYEPDFVESLGFLPATPSFDEGAEGEHAAHELGECDEDTCPDCHAV